MTNGRSITLSFSLPAESKINFSIFDVLGREVYHDANHVMNAGVHESEISLLNLESGIYYGGLRPEMLLQQKNWRSANNV